MYENSFRLLRAPFQLTPDPAFLYLSPSHKEAFASILYGVDQRKGLIVVIGEVGLGKTTVVRSYLDSRNRDEMTPLYIFNPNVSFAELLVTIAGELGITDTTGTVPQLLKRVQARLLDEYVTGRNVVLLVDEAQNMPASTLEELRVLTNLETSEKLLQIVLVGQPELADILDRHELRQVKQRIAVRVSLSPLTRGESAAYIQHRLRTAGGATATLFEPQAVRRIVDYAAGVPRAINTLCDNALVTTLGYQKRRVTRKIVDEVIQDLRGQSGQRSRAWLPVAIAALAIVSAGAGAAWYRWFPAWRPHIPAVARVQPAMPIAPPLPAPAAPISFEPAAPAATDLTPPADADAIVATPAPAGDGHASALEPSPVEPPNTAVPAGDVTRTVQRGESLMMMAREVYGVATGEILRRILDSNPQIVDPNHILIGTAVRFPDVSPLPSGAAVERPKDGSGHE
jgi:general secretion pathway protein A